MAQVKYYEQVYGNSKGMRVRLIREEGRRAVVRGIVTKFQFSVSLPDLEKFYKPMKVKKKKKVRKKGGTSA